MAEYLSDKEQEERVIKVLRKHGSNALTIILLALSAYFGYQYWQNKQINENAIAIHQLSEITAAKQKIQALKSQGKPVPEGEVTQFLANADTLIQANSKTIISQQAYLQKAQYYVANNDLDKAQKSLELSKKEYTKDKGLLTVIDLRIATILIANKQGAKAVTLLETITNKSFLSSKFELMGDAYQSLNKKEDAIKAYNQARDSKTKEANKGILDVKLQSLGVMPAIETDVVVEKD